MWPTVYVNRLNKEKWSDGDLLGIVPLEDVPVGVAWEGDDGPVADFVGLDLLPHTPILLRPFPLWVLS